MSKVEQIEAALQQLPAQEQWEVANWLLAQLTESPSNASKRQNDGYTSALPDYTARRRRIFGNKVLPNMVLAARSEEVEDETLTTDTRRNKLADQF